MNDEIKISEEAADVAKQIWNSANSRKSDYHWDAIDARLQKQMAAKVIYYADERVKEVEESSRKYEELITQRDQRIAELEAAIKELEEDKERLDWMQEYKPCVGYIGGDVQINLHRYLTFRSAIDASRKQT